MYHWQHLHTTHLTAQTWEIIVPMSKLLVENLNYYLTWKQIHT